MAGGATSEDMENPRVGKFTQGLLHTDSILSALGLKAGQTVLDAGCGNGYMAKLFSSQVGRSGKVYAMDTNSYYIETLSRGTQGGNIQTIEGDITKTTGLDNSSIDLIYISTVIHIFNRQRMQGFLRESRRLLKPGGELAIVEIEKKETPFGPPLKSRYSPEELKALIPMTPVKTVQAGEHFYMQVFAKK